MLFDRANLPPHRNWFIAFVAVLVLSCAWFWLASLGSADWPSGSTFTGIFFGLAGGGIIVFECLLWVRKRWFRVWRIGTAQLWLRIHIWLGLLCLPILIMHSGIRLGGWLSTVLMVLLVIVVASGIFGLWLQQTLPKRMLHELPAETIYSQIDTLADQLLSEADRLVSATCGTEPTIAGAGAGTARRDEETGTLVVGAIRTVGSLQGKVVGPRPPATPIAESGALAVFFKEQVAPFLRAGTPGNERLANPSQAAVLFQNLKTQVPPGAHEIVTILESFCEQRRQWDVQARLHRWLHGWLLVHFPLSIALLVLMSFHVFVAFKFF